MLTYLRQYLRRGKENLLIILYGTHHEEYCPNTNRPFRRMSIRETTPKRTIYTHTCSECGEKL